MNERHGLTRMEEQIGRLLVEGGFIAQDQFDEAKSHAEQTSSTLRSALVSKSFRPAI